MEPLPLPAPVEEHPLRRLGRRLWAQRWRFAWLLAGAGLAWVCRHLPTELQAVCEVLAAIIESVGA